MFQWRPGQLLAALAGVPAEAWSLPSVYADTAVHHGYRRVGLVTAGQYQPYAELFDFVWGELGPVRDATLSQIDPGGFVIPHRDSGPWRERWQVPILASGEWHWQEESFSPRAGVAFLARHWEPHWVTNRGAGPRIHLVVDLDEPVDRDPLPFATFPIPADMADLIERTRQ